MIKNALIILFIIGLLYYCVSNKKEQGKNEEFKNTHRLKQIFGNRGDIDKRIEVHHTSAVEIGHDEDNNKVFQFKGKMFKLNEDNELELNEPKKINYKEVPLKLPIEITEDKIKSKIPLKYNDYKFVGLLTNTFYKQYYILYEKEFEEDKTMKNFKEKLFQYILAKRKNGNIEEIHNIPARTRVKAGDNIYFSFGNFQLGPLRFV
jgi:hypothetical protein